MQTLQASTPSPVVELTDATVDGFTRGHRLAVVDVSADWYAPRRAHVPRYAELAREMSGSVAFGSLDPDAHPMFANRHDVMTLPTLLLYQDGALVGRIVGFVPKERLRGHLERLRQRGAA